MSRETTDLNAENCTDKVSLTKVFWIISIVALLWYLMDASAFFMRVFITDEALLTMPINQQAHFQDIPLWVNIVFAFEVFGGILGCLSLLFRKKQALPLFVISLLGVLSQTVYVYFLSGSIEIMGAPAVFMPIVAILIGAGMILHSKVSISKGFLQ